MRSKLLNAPLEPANYNARFTTLLHIEECQMDVDIRKYDLNDTTLDVDKDRKSLLSLKVFT